MAAATEVRLDLSSSTGIDHYLRSREELAGQVALLRLERAATAAAAWRELQTDAPAPAETQGERFERVNGRPLVEACPPGCTCRGAPAPVLVQEQPALERG
jgi:hypothetical protein